MMILKKNLYEKKYLPDNIALCQPYDESNLFHWRAIIIGPVDTPYYGGMFHLDIRVPNQFPMRPPQIKFITRVYHPNISQDGEIYLNILREQYSPALRIFDRLLLSICSFLDDPNPDCPINLEIAELYKKNRVQYNAIAKQWTQKYAR